MRSMLAVLLCFLTALAMAQEKKIYKIVLPDGRVSYTDIPPAGKPANARELPPVPRTAGIQPISPQEAEAVNARHKARHEELERRNEEALKAGKAQAEAEKAQAEGVEPRAGERTGIASKSGRGGNRTRLNDSYSERQRQLEENAENARQQAESAGDAQRKMQ